MTWYYNDVEFTSEDIGDYVGFVYEITNLLSGRKYIGKKLFGAKRLVTKKGKKKRVYKESDWKSYWGSNTELVSDVESAGEANFKRVMLHLCKSKGALSWLELKAQVLADALLREDYYNSFVGCKIHAKHVKL